MHVPFIQPPKTSTPNNAVSCLTKQSNGANNIMAKYSKDTKAIGSKISISCLIIAIITITAYSIIATNKTMYDASSVFFKLVGIFQAKKNSINVQIRATI